MENQGSETRKRVAAAIGAVLDECRLGASDGDWQKDAPLDLDSVEAVELLIRLEREFGIIIEDWELAERPLRTLDEIAKFCDDKTGGQEGTPADEAPGGVS